MHLGGRFCLAAMRTRKQNARALLDDAHVRSSQFAALICGRIECLQNQMILNNNKYLKKKKAGVGGGVFHYYYYASRNNVMFLIKLNNTSIAQR